jgi:hypothetical protein
MPRYVACVYQNRRREKQSNHTNSLFKGLGRLLLGAPFLALAACSSSAGVPAITLAGLQPASMMHVPLGKGPKALLYVSDDGTNEVRYFGWPKPKTSLGSLPGFSEPQGGCADTRGDIWMTSTGESNVLEYNGTKKVRTLNDSGGYPIGCSFDTMNGDVAVSNIATTGAGAGNVAIYKNAKGTPKVIVTAGVRAVLWVQYDGSGNLFLSGENTSSGSVLAEMPAGSTKFKIVCSNLAGVGRFGGLGWDGTYLVIGITGGVARIKNCRIVGITRVPSDTFFISGDRIVTVDPGSATVGIYLYPQGGKPIQTLTGFSEPIGVVVSHDANAK